MSDELRDEENMKEPHLLYWLKGDDQQNFGDYLSELLFDCAFAAAKEEVAGYRLIGSVIEDRIIFDDFREVSARDQEKIAYWCCGARSERPISSDAYHKCLFAGVRGPLTREVLGLPRHTTVGDTGLLTPLLHAPTTSLTTAGKTVCVPHFYDTKSDDELITLSLADAVLRPFIRNTTYDLLRILNDIASADFVLAGSLHAAIIACAYGVPFCFWDNGLVDLPFKWRDFASSVNFRPCFVETVPEGKRAYDVLIRPRLRLPPLFPILTVAPFFVKPQLLLAAAEADARRLGTSLSGVGLLEAGIERTRAEAIASQLEKKLQVTRAELSAKNEVLAAREGEIAAQKQELAAVYRSTSWRVTTPLRFVKRTAKWFLTGTRAWITLKPGSRPRRAERRTVVALSNHRLIARSRLAALTSK